MVEMAAMVVITVKTVITVTAVIIVITVKAVVAVIGAMKGCETARGHQRRSGRAPTRIDQNPSAIQTIEASDPGAGRISNRPSAGPRRRHVPGSQGNQATQGSEMIRETATHVNA